MSARNRELLGLFPVALLITAGFTAVYMARSGDLGSASSPTAAIFLALCLARAPLHPRDAARRRPLSVPAGRAAGRRSGS